MLQQHGEQSVFGRAPALYSAYEREHHQSLGERKSARVCRVYIRYGSWRRTQFK